MAVPLMLLSLFLILCLGSQGFSELDDSIMFQINWAGAIPEIQAPEVPEGESIVISNPEHERYQCFVPQSALAAKGASKDYDGPNALELLKPLFMQKTSCAYKLEQYWTYELCHGKHIRQYHEEKEAGQKTQLQEYYLGRYSTVQYHADAKKLRIQEQELEAEGIDRQSRIPQKKVEGGMLPYVTVTMMDGTWCELKGRARSTRVIYICSPKFVQDIYSVDEISTCEYEVLVLTKHLCSHPDYRIDEPQQNINCYSLDNSPNQPKSLKQLETESDKLNPIKSLFRDREGDTFEELETGKFLASIDQSGNVRIVIQSAVPENEEHPQQPAPGLPSAPLSPSLSVIADFLNGKQCLKGGTGWWRYEFCYGQRVEQYHQDQHHSHKSVVRLGNWDKEKHIKWLEENPHKRPKKSPRRHIYHLYTGGDFCDDAGKYRQVEVKLRCKEGQTVDSVSLFLLEPKVCEYTLVVESPLICILLDKVDENGLVSIEDFRT